MSSESLKSLIVTDPSLLDEGIDVSGLRTETNTDPRLLASIADFPGISYDPTSFNYLSDLNELFAYGLPTTETDQAQIPGVIDTLVDTGGGGQATSPGITDTIPELSSGTVNTAEEQRLIDAGIGVQGAPGDPVVAPSEIPYTQEQMDAENAIPVTPVSPTTQPIDPTGMLPQTSTPYMVEGALGVDPREKMDFVTAEDAADPTFLDRIGLGQFNPVEAFVKAAINKSIGLPVTFLIDTLVNTLPPQDPRQVALNELYDVQDGTIQSGLMEGYNPVSGNPLDPTYGLQEAYQDRIDTIEDTLTDKYGMTAAEIADVKAGSYTGDVDSELLERLNLLNEAKEKEKGRLDLFSGDIQEIGDAQIAEETIGTLPEITEARQKQGEYIQEIKTQPAVNTNTQSGRDEADRQQKDTGVAKVETNQGTRYETSSGDRYASAEEAAEKGDGGGGGGGGKIVCTMMNDSYGFGSFRNKIWLKHSKNLAPEYQIGYHKIFLPLVKIAKTNKIVKKTLEHIAVHRTIDIRQESRGKIHLLGRVYRRILEPICYLVGKYAK